MCLTTMKCASGANCPNLGKALVWYAVMVGFTNFGSLIGQYRRSVRTKRYMKLRKEQRLAKRGENVGELIWKEF